MSRYEQSRLLYERACRVLAGGVSSEFRRYSVPHPLFYSTGNGSHICDVDGHEYLDFTLSQGPLILGHSHPAVLAEVARASSAGQLFAGQHLAELELAEELASLIPCAELMRFSLSGSEADHAALRVARAVTGRPRFLRFEGHYHGWFDNVALSISAPRVEAMGPRDAPHAIAWTQGLPANHGEQCLILPWNDLDLAERVLRRQAHEIAAVITEPVMCNNGCIPPAPGFLVGLRHLCDELDIALIFDEVITGFRLGLGGAQQRFGVTPDLAVFGKALASGYPLSVLAGRRRWMQPIAEGTVIHAGTMNSGQPSIAAAQATLRVLREQNVLPRLEELGLGLMHGLKDASHRAGCPMVIQGLGPMFHAGFTPLAQVCDFRDTLTFDKPKYAAFVAGMQDRNIRLIGRGLWYISAAHTPAEIEHCVATAYDVLKNL